MRAFVCLARHTGKPWVRNERDIRMPAMSARTFVIHDETLPLEDWTGRGELGE